jgi:hypothetical protein
VIDYVGYLRQKAQNEKSDEIDAYKAMAANGAVPILALPVPLQYIRVCRKSIYKPIKIK